VAVNITARADAAADVAAQSPELILRGAQDISVAMSLFNKIPMGRRQERIRVESALPLAYWVNGDTGVKQTTKHAWADKLVIAEEIATILPVPINVLEDADMDLFAYIQPRASEAIARTLDAAVLFGVNAPSTFPAGIVASAMAASNTVAVGTATQANGGVAEDLNQLFGKVEDEGYDVNGVAAIRTIRKRLRGARSTQGVQLAEFGPDGNYVMGQNVVYGARGLWPTGGSAHTNPQMLVGDFSQAVLGIRKDITVDVFKEAVIQDPSTGAIAYNLMQQDMIALRFVARFGFQVSNFVTYEAGTSGSPFAVMTD
jgi:HK97 family phage major capsid protein